MAASSAFPPAFPAVTLDLDASAFVKTEYADLFHRDDLKTRISLTDGGAYDNLGVHAIRNCPTMLGPTEVRHCAQTVGNGSPDNLIIG